MRRLSFSGSLGLVGGLTLGLVLGACGGGGGDGGAPAGDDPPGAARAALAGSYSLESRLDLVGGLPVPIDDALGLLGDLTDGRNDPATFVLDAILDGIGNAFLRGAVGLARPGLDETLNQFLLGRTPELKAQINAIATDLTAVATRFGLQSQLSIAQEAGAAPTMVHEVSAIVVELRGTRIELPVALLGLGMAPARDIAGVVADDGGALEIGEHAFDLAYGPMVLLMLNRVVIPALDPSAGDLTDLLGNLLGCDAIGEKIAGLIRRSGDAGTITAACEVGLSLLAQQVEARLGGVAGGLTLSGAAATVDADADGAVEALSQGLWSGALDVQGIDLPLDGPDNTFEGNRL